MPICSKNIFFKVLIGATFFFFLIQYFLTSIYLFILPLYFRSAAFYSLIVGILFIFGLTYMGITENKKKIIIFPIFQIILLGVMDLITYFILSIALFESFVFLALIIAQLLFCLVFKGFSFRTLSKNLKKDVEKEDSNVQAVQTIATKAARRSKRKKITAILIIAIFSSTFLISFYNLNLIYSSSQKTIEPLDYQIQFSFWGSTNPDTYTPSERESLNAYNVSITSNCNVKNLNVWIDHAKYWKMYYPNVRLYANIVGEHWYFVWDGNVLDAVQSAETILKAIYLNNLTNVEGIYFDQEAPYDLKDINVFPNIKRNNEANEIWRLFFIWVNNTFPPNRFIIKTTFFGANIIDIFDHDYDLEVFMRDNIFSVPYFNEYAPMFYEAFGEADGSKVLSADRANYNLYKWLEMTRDGLTTLGLEDEFGVIIGVTNNSILGTNVGHTINHKFAGYGYDELVTQSLIVKSFGVRVLTIFTLSSGWDASGRWGGVFDSYGTDFLQKFNESINGVNSSTPFQIPIVYDNDFYQYASLDLWMSIGHELWIVLPIVILFSSILIILKKNKNK